MRRASVEWFGGASFDSIDVYFCGERERGWLVRVAVYNLECVSGACKGSSRSIAGHGGWSGRGRQSP